MPESELVFSDGKHPYTRIYDDGNIIETERVVYVSELPLPVCIENVIEVRIGATTLRIRNKEGMYYLFTKDKILYQEIKPIKVIL